MTLKVFQFPDRPACQNLPDALRELAESIEGGNYDAAHNLVWAIDCGDGRVEIDCWFSERSLRQRLISCSGSPSDDWRMCD